MRSLIILATLLFLFLSIQAKPLNVLFIAIDDLNDWTGAYGGHPQAKTPNMDQLAERGTLFTNAHCQAPICNPARVSMISGLLPSNTGIYFLQPGLRGASENGDAETMFQYFKQQGYYLTTRGKIFHGQSLQEEKNSFDEIVSATLPVPRPKKQLSSNTNRAWDWGPWFDKDEDTQDFQTALWGANRLKELADEDQPFFMAIGFSNPHVPLYVPQKWFDLYPPETLEMPEVLATDRDQLSEYAKELTWGHVAPKHDWVVGANEWKPLVQSYLACISFVDHCVGTVLDGLEQSGARDNTLIVLWSDHGFHLGEKMHWAKRTLWEESTRVPMMIAGPGLLTDQALSRPVGLIDIYPTLVDLCSLPAKEGLDGVSLRPLLTRPNAVWERPAITTFGPNNHSIRSEHWRYIRYDDGSEELYDHRNDQRERVNLAARPEHRALIRDLGRWIPKHNAAIPPGSSGSGTPLYAEFEKGSNR
ncbi:MAG: sulfatase [Verrucomicrobia bacterium]|nr:sulfatase [Verrucomicrobiota bacterium]MDA1065274.1 sulfatase [Verrucomicrobiota bacterium]